jgi:hypothetical protein
MMMIAAHESFLGLHLKQIGGGPARGIYGMESGVDSKGRQRTEPDIWRSYLAYKTGLVAKIEAMCGVGGPNEHQLTYNPIYSTIMCRIKLLQCPGPLPPADNIPAMGKYADDFYNAGGKASPDKYINDYKRLVLN